MSEDGIGRDIRPPKKTQRSKVNQYVGPDGLRRPPKFERNLNESFAIVFKSAAGKDVLNYLKSVTTNRVLEPGLPENTYSYQEGARWLMGVISTRIKDGEEKKP
jgi:hypothetical protein